MNAGLQALLNRDKKRKLNSSVKKSSSSTSKTTSSTSDKIPETVVNQIVPMKMEDLGGDVVNHMMNFLEKLNISAMKLTSQKINESVKERSRHVGYASTNLRYGMIKSMYSRLDENYFVQAFCSGEKDIEKCFEKTLSTMTDIEMIFWQLHLCQFVDTLAITETYINDYGQTHKNQIDIQLQTMLDGELIKYTVPRRVIFTLICSMDKWEMVEYNGNSTIVLKSKKSLESLLQKIETTRIAHMHILEKIDAQLKQTLSLNDANDAVVNQDTTLFYNRLTQVKVDFRLLRRALEWGDDITLGYLLTNCEFTATKWVNKNSEDLFYYIILFLSRSKESFSYGSVKEDMSKKRKDDEDDDDINMQNPEGVEIFSKTEYSHSSNLLKQLFEMIPRSLEKNDTTWGTSYKKIQNEDNRLYTNVLTMLEENETRMPILVERLGTQYYQFILFLYGVRENIKNVMYHVDKIGEHLMNEQLLTSFLGNINYKTDEFSPEQLKKIEFFSKHMYSVSIVHSTNYIDAWMNSFDNIQKTANAEDKITLLNNYDSLNVQAKQHLIRSLINSLLHNKQYHSTLIIKADKITHWSGLGTFIISMMEDGTLSHEILKSMNGLIDKMLEWVREYENEDSKIGLLTKQNFEKWLKEKYDTLSNLHYQLHKRKYEINDMQSELKKIMKKRNKENK